jgi:hypothetical protein
LPFFFTAVASILFVAEKVLLISALLYKREKSGRMSRYYVARQKQSRLTSVSVLFQIETKSQSILYRVIIYRRRLLSHGGDRNARLPSTEIVAVRILARAAAVRLTTAALV